MKLLLSVLLSLSLCLSQPIEINTPGRQDPPSGGSGGSSLGLVIGVIIGLGISLVITKLHIRDLCRPIEGKTAISEHHRPMFWEGA